MIVAVFGLLSQVLKERETTKRCLHPFQISKQPIKSFIYENMDKNTREIVIITPDISHIEREIRNIFLT